ncbi:MAG: hypothetical protein CML07_02925 [Psychrobacter sp.]|nr:hypothetical protein [Psychrobacter sp.]
MSSLWIASSVTTTNGSSLITVQSNEDIAGIRQNSLIQVGANPLMEVKRTFLSDSGVKTIELFEAWQFGAGTGQRAIAAPTLGEIKSLADDVRQLISSAEGIIETTNLNPAGGSIAKRTSDGRVKTANATEANDAVAYGQFDGLETELRSAVNQSIADNEAKFNQIETQAKLDETATLIMDYANNRYEEYEQFNGRVSKLASQIQTFTRSSEKTGNTPKGIGTVTVNQPVIELGKGISIHDQQANLFSNNNTSDFAVGRSSRVSSEIVRGVDGFVYRGNSGEVNPLIINNQVTGVTVGNNYSFSLYVQKRESDECEVVLATNGAAANGVKMLFNFSDESSFVVYNNTEYMSLYDFSYEKLSDDFYRLTLVGTLVTGTSLFCLLYWEDEKDIWAGGAQVEEGTFSSPLIPTSGSQETRTYDSCIIENVDQRDWWNQDEGTFVVEFKLDVVQNQQTILGSEVNQRIIYNGGGSGEIGCFDGSTFTSFKTPDVPIEANKKYICSIRITPKSVSGCINGNDVITGQHNGSLLAISRLGVGRRLSGAFLNGTIKKVRYYAYAFSDEELQQASVS